MNSNAFVKPMLMALGIFFVILGAIGAVLPGLPTTVFLILAGWCFSKSSDRLHKWLMELPVLGKPLRDWEAFGIIELKYKIWATSLILLSGVLSVTFANIPIYGVASMAICFILVLSYIWTRPSVRRAAGEILPK